MRSGGGDARKARSDRGREAEGIAARLLEARGFEILDRNHAIRQGEVDLVCRDGEVLVFVEVRSRGSSAYGSPALTVNRAKARRVVAAATHWALRHGGLQRAIRFDVVAVTFGDGAPRVEHLRNAFDASGAPGLYQEGVITDERSESAGAGTLYVVSTPIGNLGDLSPRAAEVLRRVRAVAAEDTRRTVKLFHHLGVTPPALLSLPAFDERGRLGPVLDRLRAGEEVALCTDAGTPGVSDPGAALVAAAWEAGARVVPIPGPVAAMTALAASGFPADRFFFAGFLPRKGAGRAEALGALARLDATLVLYEAGNRTRATLEDLAAALGDRLALVARELTKLHEELARAPLSGLAARFEGEVLGEVTIVVSGAPAAAPTVEAPAEPLEDELRRRLAAGEPPSGLAREVARARGLKRSDVYDAIERLKHGGA